MNLMDNKHEIGNIVYLKTDIDQYQRIITGLYIRPCNVITYGLTQGTDESWHYDFEITVEKLYLQDS